MRSGRRSLGQLLVLLDNSKGFLTTDGAGNVTGVALRGDAPYD
jgi:hypothetical protein